MIGAAIRAILIADPAVNAMVGGRVYPQIVPQGADMPALVYTVRSEPLNHQQGMQGFDRFDLGIDCWSRDRNGVAAYDEARSLAGVVAKALGGYRGTSQGVEIHSVIVEATYDDGMDDETKLLSVGVDVAVWAQRAP